MSRPQLPDGEMFRLLRDENIQEFNKRRAEGEDANLVNVNLRGLDLRGMNADGLNLQDAYFRNTDLRGIDFRTANIEGASLCQAKISGCFFPHQLGPEEIRLSLEFGTRLRYGR
jgi:uncharacterized protein YjbI with pentapeptide repeats